MDQHWLSLVGKRIYNRRKETVERSFADGKQLHGHRYARMRGLTRVQQQCLLAATAQNIKKIALLLSRMGPKCLLHCSRRWYRPISACCTVISNSLTSHQTKDETRTKKQTPPK